MKKLLAALMVSLSFCITQVGYTQSIYHGGNYHTEEESHLVSEETDVEPDIAITPILEWIFWNFVYYLFEKALDAAWDALDEWLDEWNDYGGEPDLEDKRIQAVCDFYFDYRYDYDLDGMADALEDGDLCYAP